MKRISFRALTALVLLLVFLLPSTALAGAMQYYRHFEADGVILIRSQVGDEDSALARYRSLVDGRGTLQRSEWHYLDNNAHQVFSTGAWQAADDAPQGLTVASAVLLQPDSTPSHPDPQGVYAVSVTADRGQAGELGQVFSVTSNGEGELSFNIDQRAHTGGGTLKRRVDLVCPGSGVFLFEDSKIKGSATVVDSLGPAGSEGPGGWQSLFEGTPAEETMPLTVDSAAPGQEKGPAAAGAVEDYPAAANPPGEATFTLAVPAGMPTAELPLPLSIDLLVGEHLLKDLDVSWQEALEAAGEVLGPGHYVFEGLVVLPPGSTMVPAGEVPVVVVHVTAYEPGEEPGAEEGDSFLGDEEKEGSQP